MLADLVCLSVLVSNCLFSLYVCLYATLSVLSANQCSRYLCVRMLLAYVC